MKKDVIGFHTQSVLGNRPQAQRADETLAMSGSSDKEPLTKEILDKITRDAAEAARREAEQNQRAVEEQKRQNSGGNGPRGR